jgi:hypothetical protein
MPNERAEFMRLSQFQVMHRVFVESLDAQRATERDHPRPGFDVTHSTAFIDGFAADDAAVIPVRYVGIFQFTHKIYSLLVNWSQPDDRPFRPMIQDRSRL